MNRCPTEPVAPSTPASNQSVVLGCHGVLGPTALLGREVRLAAREVVDVHPGVDERRCCTKYAFSALLKHLQNAAESVQDLVFLRATVMDW